MTSIFPSALSRRSFLAGSAAAGAALPLRTAWADSHRPFTLRVPNSMDGVPHLTRPRIAPGEAFTYEFDAVDAGTFWYHPHQRGFEHACRARRTCCSGGMMGVIRVA